MKPIKCDEMDSSISKLGLLEVDSAVLASMSAHIDECVSCQKNYAHIQPVLLSEINVTVPDIGASFWEKLPATVLAQVNELKADIGSGHQNDPVIDMAAYRRNLDSFDGKASHSVTDAVSDLSKKFTLPKLLLPIAASVLIVVAVVLVIQKPSSTLQPIFGNRFTHSSVEFQSALSRHSELSNLVKQFELKDTPSTMYSFAAQSKSINGFVVGTYFAESLAMLYGPDVTAGLTHLQSLQLKMSASASADGVNSLLQNTLNVLRADGASKTDHVQAIVEFSTHYKAYLNTHNPKDVVYFHLGQWLVDMALASKSGNQSEMIREELVQIDYFIQTLSAQSTLRGVTNSLKEMRELIAHPRNIKIDSEKLYSLNLKIRQLLT